MTFWQAGEGVVSVHVKVHPRARRPGLQGRAPIADGEALRIAVAAPAEGGRANAATCATLAAALEIPASSVSVARGASSRQKLLRVSGDPAVIVPRLCALGGVSDADADQKSVHRPLRSQSP